MKEKLINVFLVLSIITGFFLMSRMDLNDQILMKKQYCDNVKDGIWPENKKYNCKKSGL